MTNRNLRLNVVALLSWFRLREWVQFLCLAAGAALGVSLVPEFRAYEWSLWAIFGVLALSLAFVWGHVGIFSIGQTAFFGVGAYAYGVASINLLPSTGETISSLLIASVVAAFIAALLGYFMFFGKVADVYVAIVTLATTLVLLTVMSSTADAKYRIGDALLGGYNGMVGVPPIMFGPETMLDTKQVLLFVALIALGIFLSLKRLQRSAFGRVLAGVRENEARTELLGYDVRLYKLSAFVLGGLIAGLAGAMYAGWGMFINPSIFTLQQAALVVIWVLVGGRTSLLGAFIGVALIQSITSSVGVSEFSSWTPIILGAVLIGVVLLLPSGIWPSLQNVLFGRWSLRLFAHPLPDAKIPSGSRREENEVAELFASARTSSVPKAVRTEGLAKRFGGVNALRGVDLDVPAGTVHALIGPNGAGKSTCFNVLVGRHFPTKGHVWLGDEMITRLRTDQRARKGIGIKLQAPCVYDALSVRENLWLASYAPERNRARADERSDRLLNWLEMVPRSRVKAGVLSHGERQWLEIGMVVAGAPSVVLLDEPTAGMTREETRRTKRLIDALAGFVTVIVVEHDMDFLRELNAPVTMFHQGEVMTRGTVEELRNDPRVLDTYLGRRGSDNAAL